MEAFGSQARGNLAVGQLFLPELMQPGKQPVIARQRRRGGRR
jgi:hypothetical protein